MTDGQDPKPLVSVIVVTYNSRDYIDQCLDSVMDSAYPNIEIIVVDNNSSVGTDEHVGAKYPAVTLVQNATNMRFAIGANIGIKKSHGELIFLLNPDAWIEGNCIKELVKKASENTKIGLVGCKIFRPDHFLESAGGAIKISGVTVLNGNRKPDTGAFNAPVEVDFISGTAMAITHDALSQLGLLDPFFHFYYEETDFCWRAHRAGFKVWYTPTAVAHHHGGKSTHAGEWRDEQLEKSRVVFVLINYPFTYLAYWAVLELEAFLRLLASLTIHPRRKTNVWAKVMRLLIVYRYVLRNLNNIIKGRTSRRRGNKWLPRGFAP
jgi:GT2 family glycosyltransferase